jgi:hypothetical protein
VVPKAGVTREQVEKTLNLAVDWYRYREGCYVVETTTDENKWMSRLEPFVGTTGYLFICKFDTAHFHGMMGPDFWKWFEEKLK